MKLFCANEISLRKEMAERASEMSLDELEDGEITDKEESDNNREEKSGNYGTVEENMMYNPIVRDILLDLFPLFESNSSPLQFRLFSHVTTFGLPRSFTKTNGMLKADEPHTFGFPSVCPDITLAAGTHPLRGTGAIAMALARLRLRSKGLNLLLQV